MPASGAAAGRAGGFALLPEQGDAVLATAISGGWRRNPLPTVVLCTGGAGGAEGCTAAEVEEDISVAAGF